MDVRTAAFVTRNSSAVYECLRSAAGLGVENIEVAVYLIGASLAADPARTEGAAELVEMIDDLEGRVFTTIPGEAGEFVRLIEAAKAGAKLTEYDLCVTF